VDLLEEMLVDPLGDLIPEPHAIDIGLPEVDPEVSLPVPTGAPEGL